MLLSAVLIKAFPAALEHTEEAFHRVRRDIATGTILGAAVDGFMGGEFGADLGV